MSVEPKPSYEELLSENAALKEALVRVEAALAQAMARIAELEARLNQNSSNSSKPPSSDPPFAKPKSLRGKSGRRPGRPDGQPGVTLSQVEVPGFTVVHEPSACGGCGASLAAAKLVGVARRQVFDLPEQALEVTEHQVVARRCGCGTVTCGVAPEYVSAPVQYGPRVRAACVYLMHEQFLSANRTAGALADLFGVDLAVGTVASAVAACAKTVAPVGRLIADRIAGSPLAHFDETGFRVEGACHWLHSACTPQAVFYTVHRKRGRQAIDAAGILPRFTGIAVHDAWAPYDCYDKATHLLCSAHILREFIAVTETATGRTMKLAEQAVEALRALKKAADRARELGRETMNDRAMDRGLRYLEAAARVGVQATAKRATKLERKHNALFTRLRDRFTDYTRWVHDLRLPFDNNAAEQTVRMPKLRIKVSGSMRTLTGAEHFAAIRTYTATAVRHGKNAYSVLVEAMRGLPWIPTFA